MQGDVPEHIDALAAVGAQARGVRTTGDLPGLDALVLPGGESTVIARLATYRGMVEPIRASIAAGMPVFGSCAGMILLAGVVLDAAAGQVTLGGMDITVRRNAFGRQVDSFEEDLHAPDLLAGHEPGRPVRAVYIRAPWVEHVGEGVEVLARVGSGPAGGRIVAVRQGALMATAFHPEISPDRRIHRVFAEMVAANLD